MDVALIGAGHIAHALAEGWRRPALDSAQQPSLIAFDVDAARVRALGALGVEAAATAAEAVAAAGIVVLAVRPPDVPAALAQLAPALGRRPLVSLAAFVDLKALRRALPEGSAVARVMPNVAAAVGRGVFLVARGTLDEAGEAAVCDLFGLAGLVVRIGEEQFDAATALSGCGPAFAAAFLEAFADAGVAAGLDRELALDLAVGAVDGADGLVARDRDPGGLKRAIATPGGMTAAGLEALEGAGLAAAVRAAVEAAVARVKGQ